MNPATLAPERDRVTASGIEPHKSDLPVIVKETDMAALPSKFQDEARKAGEGMLGIAPALAPLTIAPQPGSQYTVLYPSTCIVAFRDPQPPTLLSNDIHPAYYTSPTAPQYKQSSVHSIQPQSKTPLISINNIGIQPPTTTHHNNENAKDTVHVNNQGVVRLTSRFGGVYTLDANLKTGFLV